MELKIKVLDEKATVPTKTHQTDAGWDIYASEDCVVTVGQPVKVSTGLAMAIQDGYYGKLKSRSSLDSGSVLRVKEGTLDSSYRGEVKVICELKSVCDSGVPYGLDMSRPYHIKQGQKIAQLIIQPLPPVDLIVVDELDETERGTGGFGSTGF